MATEEDRLLIRQAVADELRGHHARSRLTLDDIAEMSGYNRATVQRYIAGERSVPVDALIVLGRILDFDAGRLLDIAAERYVQQTARRDAALD